MRVLVAIPVFNEERYLVRVLDEVRRHARDVLVVDDGSTDATPRLLSEARGLNVIRHRENRGYGQSLIDAFSFAAAEQFDWVVTMDCDDQHEPARLPHFAAAMRQDDADIISGTRYGAALVGNDVPPADRRRINTTITWLVNDVLRLSLTDAFCGFKAHRVAALRGLRLDETGYAFPLQFWVQTAAAGLRIRELPVRLIYNDPTRHFGGSLDDPEARLQHYLDVFNRELARCGWPMAPARAAGSPCPAAAGRCCVFET
ncbi:MAG: glycosyltransferase family 2 protein [Phycisphaerae bacterium]